MVASAVIEPRELLEAGRELIPRDSLRLLESSDGAIVVLLRICGDDADVEPCARRIDQPVRNLALAEREATGRAVRVESTMVEAALNAAAEPIVEESAYGRLLERAGNRSPTASPQGLYACAGSTIGNERWLALSIESEAQWDALVAVLGSPAWATAFRRSHSRSTSSGRPSRSAMRALKKTTSCREGAGSACPAPASPAIASARVARRGRIRRSTRRRASSRTRGRARCR